MKTPLIFFAIAILFGCGKAEEASSEKTIQVGSYLFDFPADFELVVEKGIDSYVGKIKNEEMSFAFDFGYYSNSFAPTPQEYLANGLWRDNLAYHFMKEGVTYSDANMPKVDIISIRPATDSLIEKGCDFVASYRHEQVEFELLIYLPEEIKQMNYAIDTVDNQYRKIVWAKNPAKGVTAVYLKDLDSFNASMNGYLALSMDAGPLTAQQQERALKILRTGRKKR